MLQEKVLETIQKNSLKEKNDKIVIGVSGGPDSMCLLDILNCLKKDLECEIIVAHVNHQIRKEAQEETNYVQAFCEKLKIPVYIKYANIIELAKQEKKGTEEMGRTVRYEFFEEIALKTNANKIATAHTANDNCETILMNLLRGSAISGLKGIEIKRKSTIQNEISYIRPIRSCTRQEIENYCEEKKIAPKLDKSNLENIYTRNKIRNELIPYLQKEFNPNIIETLNRLSDLAKQDEEYFTKIITKQYETIKIGETEKEIILDLKQFNNQEMVIKTRLILYTINKLIGTTQGISKIHLEDIIKLCKNNIGNKYLEPNKNIRIFVKQGKIYLISKIIK